MDAIGVTTTFVYSQSTATNWNADRKKNTQTETIEKKIYKMK